MPLRVPDSPQEFAAFPVVINGMNSCGWLEGMTQIQRLACFMRSNPGFLIHQVSLIIGIQLTAVGVCRPLNDNLPTYFGH